MTSDLPYINRGFRVLLPYGESTTAAGSFAYAGQRRDGETMGGVVEPSGFYYCRARMYTPTRGRFMKRNSTAIPSGGAP